ncbi:MAG: anthranilate synthase component I [Clostridiaceae bacterium]|nr:anthranilate synthase component I [Clostridiaceae bacterium]
MENKLMPYTKVLPCDTETPITIYQKLAADKVGVLLESCEQPKGRYSFIAAEPSAVLKFKDTKAVIEKRGQISFREGKMIDIAREFINDYKVENRTGIPFIGGLVGFVGYDVARQYENIPDTKPDELMLPDAHLLAITELVAYDHYTHNLIIIVLAKNSKKGRIYAEHRIEEIERKIRNPVINDDAYITTSAGRIKTNMEKEEFLSKVEKVKKYIKYGDVLQTVLSIRVCMDSASHPFALYRKLRQVNPSAYLFYFNFGDYQVAGSSPEMLVELRNCSIATCPIAGTRPRGRNEDENIALEKELINDEKERSEHIMLVDLGKDDMGKVSEPGTVSVAEFMKVKHYSHVMHLVSRIEGVKKKELDMFSVLCSFLPAGTLTGAPRVRAMEIIDELEPSRRGIYGGAAGYFGFDGDMDMCIAIRTMIIRERNVILQAGAGIVAGSVPEREYDEINNKLKALTEAVRGE